MINNIIYLSVCIFTHSDYSSGVALVVNAPSPQLDRQTDGGADRQTDRQMEAQIDRQTDRWRGRGAGSHYRCAFLPQWSDGAFKWSSTGMQTERAHRQSLGASQSAEEQRETRL